MSSRRLLESGSIRLLQAAATSYRLLEDTDFVAILGPVVRYREPPVIAFTEPMIVQYREPSVIEGVL